MLKMLMTLKDKCNAGSFYVSIFADRHLYNNIHQCHNKNINHKAPLNSKRNLKTIPPFSFKTLHIMLNTGKLFVLFIYDYFILFV